MASGKADTLWNTIGESLGSQGLGVPRRQGQVGRLLNLAKQGRWDRAKVERTRSEPGECGLELSSSRLLVHNFTSSPRLWQWLKDGVHA